eukprot:gene9021-biopygen3387
MEPLCGLSIRTTNNRRSANRTSHHRADDADSACPGRADSSYNIVCGQVGGHKCT